MRYFGIKKSLAALARDIFVILLYIGDTEQCQN